MFLTLVASLSLVLLLLGLSLRWLRRATGRWGGGPQLPMQVVQRLALSPKQGIALVRLGDRMLAVSMGEGGVRTLAELSPEQVATIDEPAAPAPLALQRFTLPAVPRAGHWLNRVRSLAGRFATSAAIVVALGVAAPPASAQNQAPLQTTRAEEAAAPQSPMIRPIPRAGSGGPQMSVQLGDPSQGGLRLSGAVGVVVMMGLLTLLPTLLLMMTSFTRILIVMHFLRQAIGTQSAPPGHLIAALSLLLTGFVMGPTLSEVNQRALQPWLNGEMEQSQMLKSGVEPLRAFMLRQTRESDVSAFMEMSQFEPVATAEQVPLVVLMSAFVISELKTAFQIGFVLFLPFIVIDLVVASVLMSMGMFMLPPAMIALPFKLLLFVLVDGWSLLVQSLVASFH